MTNNNTPPMRLHDNFITFLEKAQANRVKMEIDKKTIGNPRMSKILERYFKLNNDRYVELIKMEEVKND